MYDSPISRSPASRPCFAAWLLAQDHRQDAIGELARAARRDPSYPARGDWRAVSKRLNELSADGDLHEALADAEIDWVAW